MKEIHDHALLLQHLRTHQIEAVFNEPMMPHLALYRFDRGEYICTQGQPAEILYVLVKGKVKIYTTSEEGKSLILSFKTPLEVIGDIEYVRGIDIINTVEAVSPVIMVGIQYHWLKKYGQDHAPLLQFLLEIITQKFYIKSDFLSFNLLYPVEVRLASYLLSVSYDDADTLFQGQLYTVSLTDTANLIGTSYRHLNRVIRKFCQEGLVERSKGAIIVKNREGLQQLASRNIYE
ncbi:Regulatory protein YeiL [compost metagenome]